MFAHISRLYKYNMISLYSDEYNDDEYLFNTETIKNWANEYNIKLINPNEMVIYEDIPLQFNYN
jgi:hypothetical protein